MTDTDDYEGLRARHGQGLTDAQHGLVWSAAYERGHAYGASEVAEAYSGLADLARELLATVVPPAAAPARTAQEIRAAVSGLDAARARVKRPTQTFSAAVYAVNEALNWVLGAGEHPYRDLMDGRR